MDPFAQNDGRVSSRGEMAQSEHPSSALDVIAELQARMVRCESVVSALRDTVNAAVEAGTMDPDLVEHVSHVMRKHFHHDRPEVEAPAPSKPRFDAFTGQPLN